MQPFIGLLHTQTYFSNSYALYADFKQSVHATTHFSPKSIHSAAYFFIQLNNNGSRAFQSSTKFRS